MNESEIENQHDMPPENVTSSQEASERVTEYLGYQGTESDSTTPSQEVAEELENLTIGESKIFDAPDGKSVTVQRTDNGYTLLEWVE